MPKAWDDITDPGLPVTRIQCLVQTREILAGQERMEKQIGGYVIEVQAQSRDTNRALRGIGQRIEDLKVAHESHRGWHNGTASERAASSDAGKTTVARWSAIGTWARVILYAVGMIAAAAAFVVVGRQAIQADPPTGIELRTEIKAAVRGEIKAAVADAFADMRDDEP